MTATLPCDLRDSYRLCQKIARSRARNFYYAIRLLPEQRRHAMCAAYAFFRACDDISDESGLTAEARQAQLEEWRARVLTPARAPDSPLQPALQDAIERFSVPRRYFCELIDGTLMDLAGTRYATFEDLYLYCYRVASTVGLVCLHIFGFDGSQEALDMAEAQGIAFQLTNILRDVAEDASLGRVYLPADDLARFGLSPEALLRGEVGPGFEDLLRFEVQRARGYYERSAGLPSRVDPASRPSLTAMTALYRGLLERIERSGAEVLRRRVSLSPVEKVLIAARSWLSPRG